MVMLLELNVQKTVGKMVTNWERLATVWRGSWFSASINNCWVETPLPFSYSSTWYLFITSPFTWGGIVPWVIFVTSCFLSLPTISPGLYLSHTSPLFLLFSIRWQQTSKSSGLSSSLQPAGAKADALREEMEEAANRVEICRVPPSLLLSTRTDRGALREALFVHWNSSKTWIVSLYLN